ncbi:hypothetical protein OROHE_011526 [Orobanche hederae]
MENADNVSPVETNTNDNKYELTSILRSPERDFLVRNDGEQGYTARCCEDGVRHRGMTNATRNSSDTSPDVVRGVVGLLLNFIRVRLVDFLMWGPRHCNNPIGFWGCYIRCVKVSSLTGKIVGLYFSASWCGPCQRFTPKLVEVYNELKQNEHFEIIFVSGEEDCKLFNTYFSKMPWLAIPFADSETRSKLDELFSVEGIPHLVILDEDGKLLTDEGVGIVQEHGAEGYPFAAEHVAELEELEEEAKKNQSLRSLLVSRTRDYVIGSGGKKVPIAELDGKMVGLYFVLLTHNRCLTFNPKLIETYKSLKEEGKDFEIVMVPLDEDEELFNKEFGNLPWLSLPVNDKICEKLVRYFELQSLPTVVIIGLDGETLHSNVAETIEEHGKMAYPFSPDRFAEFEEMEKAKREAQTLESILVSQDWKDILLYFSAHWCPPCRAFLPKLVQAYKEINEKHNNSLEVIFISSDRDQSSFDEFFAAMPWLALPFGDGRKNSLSRFFKVNGIPTVVAIGPTGRTVTTEARDLIMHHGSKSYPFTSERVEEIETEIEKTAKSWPKKRTHELHDHELDLAKRMVYCCDGCGEEGHVWSYYCEDCDFDLHPKCALKGDDHGEVKEVEDEEKKKAGGGDGGGGGEGWVCDGDNVTPQSRRILQCRESPTGTHKT